ncbi:methionyl-tRNA formyltransferase [bacterium]|nr:methionyl-tRNA formyltransferase [bacterium]
MNKVRTVFMGSPEFARSILNGLIGRYNLVGVVTQPDRPAGRGKLLTPPPTKQLAMEAGIPVLQPERLRHPEAYEQLAAWQPELIVVAAFGQILKQNVLDLASFGCINVHASLLPRWRGAAPIQAAILKGDEQTGVTIMKMDAGVDTGEMLAQRSIPIDPQDDTASLTNRLAVLGTDLLLETLPRYLAGEIQPIAQNNDLATYAPMINKEDGKLDFSEPAGTLSRKVRAYNPWPGATIVWEGQPLKIVKSEVRESGTIQVNQRGIINGFPAIGTGQGALILEVVQPAGKRSMSGKVFLNGARNWINTIPAVR